MDSWLRPIMSRKPTLASTPMTEHPPTFASDSNNDEEESIARIRSTSRLSLLPNFRASSPAISSPDYFPNFKQPDTVWTQPSPDQMAELLKVVMMKQGCTDPVPVQYNATILHILEAYHVLKMQLQSKDEEIEVSKESHTKDIRDFENIAIGWETKENEYKAEVKRLEILLSETPGGMESVIMARSDSLIHGSERATDSIRRGIGTIKDRVSAKTRRDTDSSKESHEFTTTIDNSQRPQSFHHRISDTIFPKVKLAKHPTRYLRHRYGQGNLEAIKPGDGQSQGEEPQTRTLTKTHLEALERQHAPQKDDFVMNLVAASPESSSDSSDDSQIDFGKHHGLGLGVRDKPLPDIPAGFEGREKQTTLDKFIIKKLESQTETSSSRPEIPRQLSFSFQPGDDAVTLSRQGEREDLFNYKGSESRPETLSGGNLQCLDGGSQPTKQEALPKSKPKTAKGSNIPRPLQEYDSMKRGDSNSSVITAVRNNSGRNSVVGDVQNGRPRIDRSSGSGSSEAAVTAAARAFAIANNKKAPGNSRIGSGTPDGSDGGENLTQRRNSMKPSRRSDEIMQASEK